MQIERGSPLKGFGSSFLKKSLSKNSFKKFLWHHNYINCKKYELLGEYHGSHKRN
jgi:hypothetical protein